MTTPERTSNPCLVRTAVDGILADLTEGDAVPPERGGPRPDAGTTSGDVGGHRCDCGIAEALDISVGDDVMHLERRLLADDQRIGLESTLLARRRFGGLTGSFDPSTSRYAAIRNADVAAEPPLLRTEGRPIELVRALYRGDRIAFETKLT